MLTILEKNTKVKNNSVNSLNALNQLLETMPASEQKRININKRLKLRAKFDDKMHFDIKP